MESRKYINLTSLGALMFATATWNWEDLLKMLHKLQKFKVYSDNQE